MRGGGACRGSPATDLSSHSSKISVVPKDFWQNCYVVVQVTLVACLSRPALSSLLAIFVLDQDAETAQVCVGSTEEHCASRRARGSGMMVQHPDTFPRETIDVGSLDLGAIAANVGIALHERTQVSFGPAVYTQSTHKVIG